MKSDTILILIVLFFFALCFMSCDMNETIPEPPEPETVHYETIESVRWNTAYRVTYAYTCSAGDARLVATLTYYRNEWHIDEKWEARICPMR